MKTIRLKYLARKPITTGLGLSGAHDNPNWPRYIRTTDIASMRTLRTDAFASQPPSVAAGAMVFDRDILMTAAGSIGKSYLHSGSAPACFAGYLARFSPRMDVDERFISYWMQSRHYWDQIETGAVRSTIDNFSAGKYRQLRVPHLPLGTQRRIADFLDDQVSRIDEVVRLRREQMDALEQRFSMTLQTCFDPGSAISVPLRRVITGMQTGSTPTVEEVGQDENSVGWYTPNSFGALTRLGAPMKAFPSEVGRSDGLVRFHAPAILFVGIGWASGRVAYMDEPGSGNQQLTAIYPNKLVRPRFLLWQLHHAGPHIRRVAPFTVLPVLSNDFLKSVPIVLPNLDTQDRSVDLLERESALLQEVRSESSAQIGLLEARKQSLITAAVTGEFEVSTASGREVVAG